MIGHYISAFVIFIIFIDDWDLSENNTDHLATPARSLNQTPTIPPSHHPPHKSMVLAFRLHPSSDVNTVSQYLPDYSWLSCILLTRRGSLVLFNSWKLIVIMEWRSGGWHWDSETLSDLRLTWHQSTFFLLGSLLCRISPDLSGLYENIILEAKIIHNEWNDERSHFLSRLSDKTFEISTL